MYLVFPSYRISYEQNYALRPTDAEKFSFQENVFKDHVHKITANKSGRGVNVKCDEQFYEWAQYHILRQIYDNQL